MFEGVGIIEPHHFISICAEFCTKKCAQNELNPKNEMTLIQMSAFLGNEVYFQKSCNVCEYLQLLTQLHPLPSRALHVPFKNSCKKDRNAFSKFTYRPYNIGGRDVFLKHFSRPNFSTKNEYFDKSICTVFIYLYVNIFIFYIHTDIVLYKKQEFWEKVFL